MDGKRYAGGVLAGLLLGVIVILGGSLGTLASPGLFGSFSAVPAINQPAAATTTASTSTEAMVVTAQSTTQAKGANGSSSASSTTTAPQVSNLQNSITSTTTSASAADLGTKYTAAYPAGASPLPSSSLHSIVHQPLFSDVIVVIPLVLALFIGGLVYRMYTKPENEE